MSFRVRKVHVGSWKPSKQPRETLTLRNGSSSVLRSTLPYLPCQPSKKKTSTYLHRRFVFFAKVRLVRIPQFGLRHEKDRLGHPVSPAGEGPIRRHPGAPDEEMVAAFAPWGEERQRWRSLFRVRDVSCWGVKRSTAQGILWGIVWMKRESVSFILHLLKMDSFFFEAQLLGILQLYHLEKWSLNQYQLK